MKAFKHLSNRLFVVFFLLIGPHKVTFCQDLELLPLFSDHMVLQQKTKAAFWGKTAPNMEVTLSASWGKKAKTRADENGEWRTQLQTTRSGGPFQVEISTQTDTLLLDDVMIGEVWLCSGQSNMEMPLAGWPPSDLIDGSEEAIRTASYENIRMFTVTRAYDDEPQTKVEGAWAVCSPETAGNFSATAFFFGRKLHETLDVPVGLIHTSWGGTPAEAWAPAEYLQQLEDFKNVVADLKVSKKERDLLENWLQKKKTVEVNVELGEDRWKDLDFGDSTLASPKHSDEAWPKMQIPALWESTEMPGFDGVIWFRKRMDIPEEWQGKNLVLELGPIDDMDRSYFNGQFVGGRENQGFWQEKRSYKLSPDLVRPGENVISVRVVDTGGGGGLYGSPDELRIFPEGVVDTAITLAGEWRYLPVAEYTWGKFFVFGTTVEEYASRPKTQFSFGPRTPTVLYNAMIAPVVPYSIKGAIWYQGESNVGRAAQYEKLFPEMIQSWRDAWGKEFPFYYVQIAPFRYSGAENTESGDLRNAQNRALKTSKTGQVVTLDIGNVDNIHPGDKKDVGERLARWALAKDYNKKSIIYSGPVCKSAELKNGQIVLKFDATADGLSATDDRLEGFELVFEGDSTATAEAVIQGETVVLSLMPGQKPKAVRYAWKNGSTASLFNSAGLPASTFYLSIK